MEDIVRSSPDFERNIDNDTHFGSYSNNTDNIAGDNSSADSFAAVACEHFALDFLRLVWQVVHNVLPVHTCRVQERLLDMSVENVYQILKRTCSKFLNCRDLWVMSFSLFGLNKISLRYVSLMFFGNHMS